MACDPHRIIVHLNLFEPNPLLFTDELCKFMQERNLAIERISFLSLLIPSPILMPVAPGLVTVFCRACLDNPRLVHDNHNFGVVNAIFFSS